MEVSVAMITFDAERRLEQVLRAAAFAREIVVVDSGSRDRTLELCRAAGARVVSREFRGYGDQKNFALGLAECDWVLSLDADEVVSPALAREIAALPPDPPCDGYRIPRLNYFFGRPLHHGGLYPDRQLRLLRRGRGRFDQRPVHEAARVEGPVGRLRGELHHFSYDHLDDYFARFDRYTRLEAGRLTEACGGRSPGPLALARGLCLRPAAKFLRRYLLKAGFLDGAPGLVAALLGSFTMSVSYARHWEQTRKDPADPQ